MNKLTILKLKNFFYCYFQIILNNLKLASLNHSIKHLLIDQSKLIQINNHLLSDQNKIKILNQQILDDSVLQHKYLKDKGWYSSFKDQRAIDANGNPIPWYTYPAIDFAEKILKPNHNIFEFGSGNSSLWFAKRCASVKAVEHDLNWSMQIRKKAPANLNLCYQPKLISGKHDVGLNPLISKYFALFPDPEHSDENESYGLLSQPYINYCSELFDAKIQYDIIVIDSVARGLSSFLSLELLAEGGYLIFDNSNWVQYGWILDYIQSQGFGRIDFHGPGPQNNYEWCTTFLSKKFSNIYS